MMLAFKKHVFHESLKMYNRRNININIKIIFIHNNIICLLKINLENISHLYYKIIGTYGISSNTKIFNDIVKSTYAM